MENRIKYLIIKLQETDFEPDLFPIHHFLFPKKIKFDKKLLKEPLKKLPLYPEMNEFDQTSLQAYQNGLSVAEFHSFLFHIHPLPKEKEFLTFNFYCNTND